MLLVNDSCKIDKTAIIGNDVKLGSNVIIHPFVIIADNVEIGDYTEIFPYTYIGKEPKSPGCSKKPIEFEKKIIIGAGCMIGPNAVIYYDVEIGSNVLIGDGVSIREQCRIGSSVLLGRHVTLNYNVCIDNETKVMDLTHLTGNMKIGKRVFISCGVMTANDNKIGAAGFGEHVIGPTIDDEVKIGAGAILLPKIYIGSRSVIAAGSVVTKDVTPDSLVKGIPAKNVYYQIKN